MNHCTCSRCGAALAHLNALLGHYQEVSPGCVALVAANYRDGRQRELWRGYELAAAGGGR